MSEETVVAPVVEAPVVEAKVEPSVPELNPVEQQAIEQGWLPKEDWVAAGRNAEEHRSAKEFVERGELYKSIHTTRRELKQTQQALDALQRHHRYVFEKAHEQAVRDLRAEKRLAIRNEDFDRVEEIETEIDNMKDRHQKEAAQVAVQMAPQAEAAPAFQLFVDRNPWYIQDKSLRDEADAAGFIYLNNGGAREGLFAHVEKEMKRKFPDKFGVKRAAPNAVASPSRAPKKSNEGVDMSAEERQIMMTFVNQGIMSEADYIKELKKAGR